MVTYKGTPTTRKDIQRLEMESGQYNVLLTTYDYVMKVCGGCGGGGGRVGVVLVERWRKGYGGG